MSTPSPTQPPRKHSLFDVDSHEREAARHAASTAPNQVAFGKSRPQGSMLHYGGELENYQALKKQILEEQEMKERERRKSLGLPEVEEKHGVRHKMKEFARKHSISATNSAGFRF